MKTLNRTLTMTELENLFNLAISIKENYIGVRIKYPDMIKPKILIFSNEDFEVALEAFKITYNYDLSHTEDKNAKITGFMYGNNFAEIQDWLVY